VTERHARRMPRGVRDSRSWYRDVDPMSQVDPALVDFVAERAGRRVLDLGCGLGGYSRALSERGHDCYALDVVAEYVETARELGVRADLYDGERLPLEDRAVDTVILIEVLEHLDEPASLLREAARVARDSVLVTTPNCTQSFGPVPIEFSHMLDADHRQFFTVTSLRELLEATFASCEVLQSHPVDEMIADLVLPRPLPRLYRGLARVRAARPRYFERLLGQGWLAEAAQR
jgi:2-polyprenyl-3-methyl-5-hydroxy-6-metoxy-1,4-benzoquinol methylase